VSAPSDTDLMLRPEVAVLFRVDPQTITRWTASGYLHPIVTPGGQRRYFAGEVHALIAGRALSPLQLSALRERRLRESMKP
jgi:hypothetical protein